MERREADAQWEVVRISDDDANTRAVSPPEPASHIPDTIEKPEEPQETSEKRPLVRPFFSAELRNQAERRRRQARMNAYYVDREMF